MSTAAQERARIMLDRIAAEAARAGRPGPPPAEIDEDGWIGPVDE